MKQLSASVLPSTSSRGTPKCSVNRRWRSAGSASPAEVANRTDANVSAEQIGVEQGGHEPGRHGQYRRMMGARRALPRPDTDDGAGLRIVVPPAANGKVIELPSPYAKNSFGTDRKRSVAAIASTVAPMLRAVASGA